MDERILFVDDDPNILSGYQRQLRKMFSIHTAANGEEGLNRLSEAGPFSVVVSDFRMPGLDGIQFLTRVREAAPDTVRILLTGYADLQTAIEAINEGNIFRLLTKPCDTENLLKALQAGFKQYHLIIAERELLEKTLKGSIQVLTEIISMVNPEAFSRASRITRYVREIGELVGASSVENPWVLETAARLSQVGCLILPEELILKMIQGQPFSKDEATLFEMHPSIASNWLAQIPRLEEVAEIIAYQNKGFDGSGSPLDTRQGDQLPLGARILKVVLDFDLLTSRDSSPGTALARLIENRAPYDPLILVSLKKVLGVEAAFDRKNLMLSELREKMILAEDVYTIENPKKLIAKDYELSGTIIETLKKYDSAHGLKQPIQVLVPLAKNGSG